MRIKNDHLGMMLAEWDRIWRRFYLPNFNLSGKTVFDAGAGSGETAHFFFSHGAKKIIAVDVDPTCLSLLRENAEVNGWNIEILDGGFHLDQLRDRKFDFMKMDVEGAEVQLLGLKELDFPIVLEVHKGLAPKFMQKFSLRPFHYVGLRRFWEAHIAGQVLLHN